MTEKLQRGGIDPATWDLCANDDEARTGLRKAISEAWPKLQAALVAAFSATHVKAVSNVRPQAAQYAIPGGGSGGKQKPSPVAGMATLEGYAALCGAVQLNCMTVKVPSPIVRYIVGTPEAAAAPHPLAPSVQWLVDEQAERVARRVEEEESILDDDDDDDDDEDSDSDSDDDGGESGDEVVEFTWGRNLTFDTALFPAMKGAGVYPLVSSLNHSCSPNCEVAYINDSKVLVLVKRKIAPGEELTISYVDTELTQSQRREELQEVYGFTCKCEKCAPSPDAIAAAKVKGKSPANGKAAAAGAKRKASEGPSDGDDDNDGKKKAKKGEGNGCVVC